jgi:hypothetical protein
MQEIIKRLEIITERIRNIISLQMETQARAKELEADNQELNNKIHALETHLKTTIQSQAEISKNKEPDNNQKNKETNNKINELIKEAEQCIAMLKNTRPDEPFGRARPDETYHSDGAEMKE